MATAIEKREDLTSRAIAQLGWKAEQIDVIRRSVAKDATPAELYQFLYLCKAYDLDPFKREIYFMKDSQGRPAIITGIDGFRKAARRDKTFKGVQAFAVREGDEFEIDATNYTVKHRFGSKRGKVIGAWAKADAQGRNPVVVWIDFDEFAKPNHFAWKQMPSVMIAKVAESHAIRRQFGLAGLYTQEEMGVEQHEGPTVEAEFTLNDIPASEPQDDPQQEGQEGEDFTEDDADGPQENGDDHDVPATSQDFTRLWLECRKLGADKEFVHQTAGVETLKGWTKGQLDELLGAIRTLKGAK